MRAYRNLRGRGSGGGFAAEGAREEGRRESPALAEDDGTVDAADLGANRSGGSKADERRIEEEDVVAGRRGARGGRGGGGEGEEGRRVSGILENRGIGGDVQRDEEAGTGDGTRRTVHEEVSRRGDPEPLAVPRRRASARRHTRDVRRARCRRDDVGVGALESKRADAALGGALRRAGGRGEMLPGERHGVDGAGGGIAREAREVRVDRLQVHDAARAEGAGPKHRVKQPHRTGSGLGVPHARFHR